MFVPFDQLPRQARLWIYTMDRPPVGEETPLIESCLQQFCQQWNVHGSPLQSSFSVRYQRFVLLAANEEGGTASGCSIDSSVRVLKYLQQQTGIDFMDRRHTAFWINDQVVLYPNSQLKELFAAGVLTGATPAFNNLVDNKGDLDVNWVIPAGQTWLARYITRGSLV